MSLFYLSSCISRFQVKRKFSFLLSLYSNLRFANLRPGLIAVICCLICCTPVFSQTATNFQRVYGGTLQDQAFSVITTQDGGYAMTGITTSFGAGNQDVYVIKTDANGNEQWSKSFGGPGIDRGWSIIQTSDGGYMIGGETRSFGAGAQDLFFIRLDASGNTLWIKAIGLSNFEYTRLVRETPDGGFISLGYSNSTGLGQNDLLLVKLNATGDILWTKAFGLSVNEFPHYLDLTSDGGFALIGYRNLGSLWELYMLKADSVGNFEWAKTYSGPALDIGYAGQQTNLSCTQHGGFLLTGYTTSFGAGGRDMIVIKTDSLGDVTWAKTYGGSGDDQAYSVLEKQNGDFIVGGITSSFGSGLTDLYLVTIDNLGNLKTSSTFGGGNVDAAAILDNNIQFTTDGGLIMAGRTNSFGFGSDDFYLIKIDSVGNSGCNQVDNPATLLSTPSLTVNVINPNVVAPLLNNISPLVTTTTPATLQDTLCLSFEIEIDSIEITDTAIVDASCDLCTDGSINITVIGGIPPLQFLWSNGETTEDIASLNFGVYSVTITDIRGEPLIAQFTVGHPDPMEIATAVTDATCDICSDGSIDITVSEGVPPFLYVWSNGETTEDLTNLSVGVYIITVMDNQLDEITAVLTVGSPNATCWTGTISGNFFDDDNWTAGAPGKNDPVIIGDANATGELEVSLSSGKPAEMGSLEFGTGLAEVTLKADEHDLKLNGDLKIGEHGTIINTTNKVSVQGNLTIKGAYDAGANTTILWKGEEDQVLSGNLTFYDTKFMAFKDNDIVLLNDMVVENEMKIAKGTLKANDRTIMVGGNWVDDGAFDAGTGTVIFNGGGDQTISTTKGDETFHNLTISGLGSLIANENDLKISGDWENNAAFDPGTSTVTFDGADAQSIRSQSGEESFYKLTFTGGGAKSLEANVTVTEVLDLGDERLDIGTNEIRISNTAIVGLVVEDGFINTTQGGAVVRATESTDMYITPIATICNPITLDPNPLEVAIRPGRTDVQEYELAVSDDETLVLSHDKSLMAGTATTTELRITDGFEQKEFRYGTDDQGRIASVKLKVLSGDFRDLPEFYYNVEDNTSLEIASLCDLMVAQVCVFSTNLNYVLTDVLQVEEEQATQVDFLPIGEKFSSIQYFDGLGRTIQNIGIEASPQNKDIISFNEFDAFGRLPLRYLPFTKGGNCGDLVEDPVPEQFVFYNTEPDIAHSLVAFSETEFGGSPINRPIEQGAPGAPWQVVSGAGKGNTMGFEYRANTSLEVRRWEIAGSNCISNANYAAGELWVTQTTDENGHIVFSYTDKLGRVVQSRSITLIESPDVIGAFVTDPLETYYVYDSFRNLVYVIPPEAMSLMRVSSVFDCNALVEDLVYRYGYDKRQRLLFKKVPGAEPTFFVYDNLDRVILTQDGNLHAQNQWRFIKYDALGREIMSGLFEDGLQPHDGPHPILQPDEMQDFIDQSFEEDIFPNHEERSGANFVANFGYTNSAFPTQHKSIYIVNYFDDYDFDFNGTADEVYLPDPAGEYSNNSFDRVRNKLTTTRVRILNNTDISAAVDWIYTVDFFDKFGRIIQTKKKNQFDNWDITYRDYDFSGRVVKSRVVHNLNTLHHLKVSNRFVYDHNDRVEKVYQQNGNDAEIILVENTFNEVENLAEKKVHSSNNGSSFLETTDFTYNIRNWLTNINDRGISGSRLFGMDINYEENVFGFEALKVTPMLNGNISAVAWQSAGDNGRLQSYQYAYDEVNRLKEAKYAQAEDLGSTFTWTNNVGLYDVSNISYDHNGNILSLNRKGFRGSGMGMPTFSDIDILSYSYNGNQLVAVNDVIPSGVLNFEDHFSDGTSTGGDEYDYDLNGNMTFDENKGALVLYNYLNLPVKIDFGSDNELHYLYDAKGTKLGKRVKLNGGGESFKFYSGDFVHNGAGLEFYFIPEGRVIPDNTFGEQFRYEYEYRDYLGNTRLRYSDLDNDGSIDPGNEIVQQTHYYPFGMSLGGLQTPQIGPEHKYKFNNKELQDEFGLNWYDYGARMLDVQIGRWHVIDPLASLMPAWSPYTFVLNNPLSFIDLDGRIPYPITIRSFAPFETFGKGFHGDGANRGFTTSSTATARIHQTINFDTDETILNTNVWSSPSAHILLPGTLTGSPTVSIENFSISKSDGSKTFDFGTHSKGSNPYIPGSPNIDVFSRFSITTSDGLLTISGDLKGDNFPSTEAFITDPNGNKVFIGIGFYEGSPFSSLDGENKRDITSFDFGITIDKNGNFTGVNYKGKKFSLEGWNNRFEEADPLSRQLYIQYLNEQQQQQQR